MSTKGEINCNQNGSSKFRRKNQHRKTGLNKSAFKNEVSNFPFCPTNRMFPMSEPQCYPFMNYPMSFEPMSLPYLQCYHNHCTSSPSPISPLKTQDADLDFMSLPCVNDLSDNDMKRRFSDPGLPNDNSPSVDEHVLKNLTEQVNSLKDSNHRLCREVQTLKTEVNYLKQQLNVRFYDQEYEPGMLSDIVRQIRDAARVREEALLSKVKHMIEERQLAMSHQQALHDKSRTTERMDKLEEQLRNFCLGSSYDDSASAVKEVFEMEQGNLAIRRELQEERSKRKQAEEMASRLQKLLAGRTSVVGDANSSGEDSKTGNGLGNGLLTPKPLLITGPVTSL